MLKIASSISMYDELAATAQVIRAAISSGRQAQRVWAGHSVGNRLRVLRKLRHSIASHGIDLAKAIVSLNRTPAQRLASEVLPLADAIKFLERRTERALRPTRWSGWSAPLWLGRSRLEIVREPFGVVLIIAASNYPLLLAGAQAMAALAAGNAVCIKPAPGHSAVISQLRDLAITVGLAPDLLFVLSEDPSVVQSAIKAGIDKVILTGAHETGVSVLLSLAPHAIPSVMELSGCDAAFICPDADLKLAARALAFALGFNGGASCIAPRRVFLPHAIARDFEALLLEQLDSVPTAVLTPDVLRPARNMVIDTLTEGARLLSGGRATKVPGDDRHQARPLVLTDCKPQMSLLHSDVFAPVLCLVPVADLDEALSANEACPFALGAVVFGSDKAARELAARINAGAVVINDVIIPHADPRMPLGPRGASGFGVTRGIEGLLEMTRVKAVSVRPGRFRPHFDPPRETDETMFALYLAAAHGGSLLSRGRAVLRLFRTILRLKKGSL